jgi:uncharacterized protein (DUF433 family)
MKQIAPRITADPGTCGGRHVIEGTRMPVEIVLGQLSAGMTVEEVCEEYRLEREDVLAVLHYAMEIVGGQRTLEVTWDPEAHRWMDDDDAFDEIISVPLSDEDDAELADRAAAAERGESITSRELFERLRRKH